MEQDRWSAGRRRWGRRAILRAAALTGIAPGITSIGGCASAPATSGAPTSPAAAPSAQPASATPRLPKMGGTFRTSFQSETPNLDPHLVSQASLHVFGPGTAYSKLLQYRSDVKPGALIPTADLAVSWEQPDETTYVFKLRPDAKFQNIAPVNGRSVVADDVKYSFERQIALKVGAGTLPQLARIEVVDPVTVKLVAAKPDADFLVSIPNTTNKIIAREAVDLKGDLKEGPTIGSGPWIFERWERDKIATMVKNPDYYLKGFPRVDRLEIPRVVDAGTLFSAFRAKEVDVITTTTLTPKDVETISAFSPDIVSESFKDARGVSMYINASKPPFDDIRVRQAIFKAIDKQAIIDTVFSGQAWYWAGIRAPSPDYYLPDAEIRALYKQDLAAARQLLAQANVTLDLEIFALGFGTTYKDSAELVQSDLAKAGIKSRIKVSDTNPQWANATQVGDGGGYEVAIGAGLPVSANADLYTFYHSSAPRYIGKVKDPAFDALIDQQAVMTRDPEARKKALQDIQRYIVNSAQALYLVGVNSLSLRWKYIQDYFYAFNVEETYARLWLDK